MASSWIQDTLPYATVAAAARFVPIPLMDDVVKSAAVRASLSRLLVTRQEAFPAKDLKPLYASGSLLGALLRFPLKILLFPIRKVVKIISAARGVPKDFLQVFLLMRAVSHALDTGVFDVSTRRKRKKKAKLVRRAFDDAFENADLSILSAALGDVLEHSKAISAQAISAASDLIDFDFAEKSAPASAQDGGGVEEGTEEDAKKLAQEVEDTLNRSDVEGVLVEFDARFERELARQRRR